MNIKLRILDSKRHEATIEVLKSGNDGLEISINNMYVEYKNLTDSDIEIINDMIDREVYRKHGDELQDYDFQEVNPISNNEFESFDEFYEAKKSEYHEADKSTRETKRVHEGIYDLIHNVARDLNCKNNTAITTMLLEYGNYKFHEIMSDVGLEGIKNYYFKNSLSAFDHNKYHDGIIANMVLSRSANVYYNSRCVILDVVRRDRVVHFYPREYIYKTLEDLSKLGFNSKKARFGYEILILLALEDCELIKDYGIESQLSKLIEPTIETIKIIANKANSGELS